MRNPRNICSIIGGLAGVPLGGIEGISIQSGGAPPQVPITTKIEIFQSPAPPPPPPPPTPPSFSPGAEIPSGAIDTTPTLSIGGFIAQAIENLNPFPTLRAQQVQVVGSGDELRTQPFQVPELDLGFKPQPSGRVTGEIETLNTGREFRPSREIQTLDQGNIQTGQGGTTREITTSRQGGESRQGGQQTLETIEQSRQEFQSGHFVDPPGELDFVQTGPAQAVSRGQGVARDVPAQPCATCSMLNPNPDAKDSYPVEMIFHFKNHASAQRLGGLCEADGECEIA